ncbi:MAG: 30S ribosomal protein S3 [Lewinellaceae bacterium]|jgi:small subunit ribosomal protein S3|nr:30S ribosomal protein S3 [Lewinellaceae bacterium]
MGQKANPIGNRLGIIRGWDSNWYADKDYGLKVVEDEKIRNYLRARRPKTATADPRDRNKPVQNGISRIVIERTMRRVTVTIHTSRPGIIIGKGGKEVDLIKEELKVLTDKEVQINIFEIRKPELDANIVGEQVAKQIEARINFRRAVKGAIQGTMRAGAEGIKIRVSGRLGGAEIARTEEYKEGRTPLHTFRADIDYAWVEAQTVYGKIGIKVWLFKGEVLQKRELTPFAAAEGTGGDRRDRREGGERREGGGERRDRRDGGGERRDRRDGGGGDRRGGGGGGNRGGGGGNRGGSGGGGNRGGGGGGRR